MLGNEVSTKPQVNNVVFLIWFHQFLAAYVKTQSRVKVKCFTERFHIIRYHTLRYPSSCRGDMVGNAFEGDWISDRVCEKFGYAFQKDNICDLSFIWITFPFSLTILDIFYDNWIVDTFNIHIGFGFGMFHNGYIWKSAVAHIGSACRCFVLEWMVFKILIEA